MKVKRINLYHQATTPAHFKILFITLALILVETVLFFAVSRQLETRMTKLQNQEQRLETEAKSILAEIETLKQQPLTALNNKSNQEKLLQQLEEHRSSIILMVAFVAETLPNNTWIKNIEMRGSSVHIQGYAHSHDLISQYVQALSQKKIFSHIEILYSENDALTHFKKFALKCEATKVTHENKS